MKKLGKSIWTVPLLVGGGLVFLTIASSILKPKEESKQLPFNLKIQYDNYLSQAQLNPLMTNANEIDAFATQLESLGFNQQGSVLRGWSKYVRQRQGTAAALFNSL